MDTRPGEGRRPETGDDGLASVAETLSGLTAEARAGSLDDAAALTALAAARRIAAELEHCELALIDAARADGATWSRIATAMGTSNRQTAQKRHADLARRCTCPPSVDTSATQPGQQSPEAGQDRALAGARVQPPLDAGDASNSVPGARRDAGLPAAPQRRSAVPRITDAIIAEGRYELVRAPDHAETHAWHVLAGGRLAGLVRPTWRGERSRPGWEPVDTAGTALPATGIGRVTSAGNARTRDAAAVSLLRALQRQQGQERKKAAR